MPLLDKILSLVGRGWMWATDWTDLLYWVNLSIFDTVKAPAEAAAVLLVCCAKLEADGKVSPAARPFVLDTLAKGIARSDREARTALAHAEWLCAAHAVRNRDAIAPMASILAPALKRGDKLELATALDRLAHGNGGATPAQAQFVRAFREAMGLPTPE